MAKKLNVICLGGFTYPSGMAGTKRVQHFIDYLFNNGNNVSVITLGNTDRISGVNKSKGEYKGVNYFNLASSIHPYLFYLLLPVYWLAGFFYLLKLRKNGYKNILYVYNSFTIENIFVIILSKLAGYKTVVDVVEDYSTHLEKVSFVLSVKLKSNIFFEKYSRFLCDGVVVLSEYLVKRFEKISQGKIPVINIPISASVKNPDRVKQSFNEPVTFSYSGSFGNKDGLSFFIQAFKNISDKYPNCILYLSGKGNDPQLYLKNYTKDNIKYLGYISDEEYYSLADNSDILCMTRTNSKYANAGFPFKLGEYLATGNPVITSNVSDVSMYLENGKDAIIVDSENSEQLTQSIDYLMSNPEKAFEIGANGRKKALKFFNPETNGKKLVDFINTL